MEKVTRFGISLPVDVLKKYDEIIKRNGYSNRSKAILDLIREYIKTETVVEKKNYVLGIRYNHRNLMDISEIENSYPCTIISSYNLHLDLNNSFKVLTLYGEEKQLNKIINKYKDLGTKSDISVMDMSEQITS